MDPRFAVRRRPGHSLVVGNTVVRHGMRRHSVPKGFRDSKRRHSLEEPGLGRYVSSLSLLFHILNPTVSECKDLIRKCLAPNGSNRPSMEDILQHPWLQEEDASRQLSQSELNGDRHKLASVPARLGVPSTSKPVNVATLTTVQPRHGRDADEMKPELSHPIDIPSLRSEKEDEYEEKPYEKRAQVDARTVRIFNFCSRKSVYMSVLKL